MGCAFVMLPNGLHALVDESDLEVIDSFRWVSRDNGYVATNLRGERAQTLLHKLLVAGICVDHENRKRYDNRRQNLRSCTYQQNNGYSRKQKSSRITSQYKGVGWDRGMKKWRARGQSTGSILLLEYYDDETEAARAYDRWALKVFGNFAFQNFQ